MTRLANLIDLLVAFVVLVIVAEILFVVFRANPANDLVKPVHDVATFLVGPFDHLFTPRSHRLAVAINFGIAATVYGAVGHLLAGFLRGTASDRLE